MTLAALVTALMLSLSPHAAATPDGRAIGEAIAHAVSVERDHGTADWPLVAATMVVFAWDESRFQVHPRPQSWDARAGRVCGAWQLACAYVAAHSLEDQAAEWLRLVHIGSLSRVGPSPRASRARLSLAMGYLERMQTER